MSFDMLAWLIAPSEGQAGFAPHRDRQPSDVRGSFHPDGSPKYCTAWSVLLLTVAPPTLALSLALSLALALTLTRVALGDADAETSCLYLIPRGVDPGYDAGDDATEVRLYGVSRPLLPFWPPSFCTPHAYPTLPALPSSLLPTLLLYSHPPHLHLHPQPHPHQGAEDPLVALLRSDSAVQSIRACPLPAGGAVLFSHRVMHWGSRGHPRCTTPRFSLSFGCADPSFERAYLKTAASHLPFPRPAVRAGMPHSARTPD